MTPQEAAVQALQALKDIRWFKVLNGDMRSFHGGQHTWELDKWYEVDKEPSVCHTGFHLTPVIRDWAGDNCAKRAFVVEVDWNAGFDASRIYERGAAKIAVRRCRLVRELTDNELCEHGVMFGQATTGVRLIVSGEVSRVGGIGDAETGSCNALIVARDSARVFVDTGCAHAYDSSSIHAIGSTYTHARTDGRITASGCSVVRAQGSGDVFANESATVIVERYDACRIFLADRAVAVVHAYHKDTAILIAKRHNNPACAIAGRINHELNRDKWKVVRRNGELMFVPR